MGVISNKDGDLLSQFDNFNENDIPVLNRLADLPVQIRNTPHQKMLINNQTDANKGKIKGYLYLEDMFGFCETFKKVTRDLGFQLTFRTNDLQDTIYTSMTDDINVTINNLYLYVRNLIPSVETQVMFNEATQNNYKISYDEWFTERRIISDTITQLDIGSSQNVQSPEYLMGAHQTKDRIDGAISTKNVAIFDNLDLRKYNIEIDGQKYPRDSSLMNYEQNDYIEQYKDLKLFFMEYIGEQPMSPFISYPGTKTKYPIEIIDLRHQSNHISLKKIQLFLKDGADPEKARLFLILNRRREIELISDGNKLIEFKVIQKKILNFKDFIKKYNLKDDTMNEFELQRVYNYPVYSRGKKIYSDEGFINIDNGNTGGSHWTCFYIKHKKSCYFDSFGGQPDKFLLNQLPKRKIYQNYKIQDSNSKMSGSYCLYFLYLIKIMN